MNKLMAFYLSLFPPNKYTSSGVDRCSDMYVAPFTMWAWKLLATFPRIVLWMIYSGSIPPSVTWPALVRFLSIRPPTSASADKLHLLVNFLSITFHPLVQAWEDDFASTAQAWLEKDPEFFTTIFSMSNKSGCHDLIDALVYAYISSPTNQKKDSGSIQTKMIFDLALTLSSPLILSSERVVPYSSFQGISSSWLHSGYGIKIKCLVHLLSSMGDSVNPYLLAHVRNVKDNIDDIFHRLSPLLQSPSQYYVSWIEVYIRRADLSALTSSSVSGKMSAPLL